MDSETVLQAIEANLVSSTQRVSGELTILQSSVIGHLNDQIAFHITKILQNIWLLLVLSSTYVSWQKQTKSIINVNFKIKPKKSLYVTYPVLSVTYLSGIRPSFPLKHPSHQSSDTCLKITNVSPFLNDNSRPLLPSKSYSAVASNRSFSEGKKNRHVNRLLIFARNDLKKHSLSYKRFVTKKNFHVKR